MAIVSERVWRGQQSWDGERIDVVGGRKIRATIHRDGYDFQSYGRVHVWTGTEWSLVLSRTVEEMPLFGVSYTQGREKVEGLMMHALSDLLVLGYEIVGE